MTIRCFIFDLYAGRFHSVGLGPRERVGNADVVLESLKNIRLETILKLLKQHP